MTSVQKENSSTLGEADVESFFKKPVVQKPGDTVKKPSPPPKAVSTKPNNFDDVLTGGFKTLDLDDEK